MANRVYSDMPGFVAERELKCLPGGHVVLFDRHENPTLKGTSRWLVMHFPSGGSASFSGQAKAKDALKVLQLGRDEWGLLPCEAPMGDLNRLKPRAESGMVQNMSEAEKKQMLNPSPQGGESQFGSVLTEKFDDDQIGEWIRELCTAEKDNGEPDWTTREKGLKLLLSYREGTPIQRQETIVKDTISPEDVLKRLKNNKKYREAFLDTFGVEFIDELREVEAEEVAGNEEG